jgi:hypothetical protein
MLKSWPSSPFTAAQHAFDLLTCPPESLVFDSGGLEGVPQRVWGLVELKGFLICDRTPRWVRDVVWRDLVSRARCDGPSWVVAAVGLAMPGLRRAAGTLSCGRHGATADWDSALLEGFLERLRTIDVDGERICGRLIDAGVRAVKLARAREETNDVTLVDTVWSLPPAAPFDHPDLVLARAVAAAVIAPEELWLISETRLDDLPLADAAKALNISVALAAAHRRAAELRVADAIHSGLLDWVGLIPRAPGMPPPGLAA